MEPNCYWVAWSNFLKILAMHGALHASGEIGMHVWYIYGLTYPCMSANFTPK